MVGEKFTDLSNVTERNTLDYFVNAIVTSRIETGLRSNSFCTDEDVNMYLAHLLKDFMSPEYISSIKKYVCIYEADLIERQEGHKDLRERFYLYKHTADYILFMLAIMRGLVKNVPAYQVLFRLSNEVYASRARSYYAQAAEYQKRLRGRSDGVVEVLTKLSDNFIVYLNVLHHVGERHLGFIEQFSDGEWFHFVRKSMIDKGTNDRAYKKLMDAFLVCLSSLKKDHSQEARDSVRIIAEQLKKLNSDFHCDVEHFLNDKKAV